jgi:hypothetical protein
MNGSAIDLELIKNAVQRLLFAHPDLTGEQIAHDYRPQCYGLDDQAEIVILVPTDRFARECLN